MTDHVDGILAQWAAERPDLNVSPMAVLGRLSRTSRLTLLQALAESLTQAAAPRP